MARREEGSTHSPALAHHTPELGNAGRRATPSVAAGVDHGPAAAVPRDHDAEAPPPSAIDLTHDAPMPAHRREQSGSGRGAAHVRVSPLWAFAASSEPRPRSQGSKKRKSIVPTPTQQPCIQRFLMPAKS